MKISLTIVALLIPTLLIAESWSWDFEGNDLAKWKQIEKGQWQQIEVPERGSVLELTKSAKPPTKPVRRPANLLLAPTPELGAFTLEFDARTLVPKVKGADITVVFGYQDPHHFYYAHISNDSDNRVHHLIMKVEGGKEIRTQIDDQTDPPAVLNGEWQKIRVTRSADGRTAVYVDDMSKPTLTTSDTKWLTGKIGLGSFNDPAQFDNVVLETPAIP